MNTYRRITRSDRYQLERYLGQGKKASWIAKRFGMHRSTVYREIRRGTVVQRNRTNLTPQGCYSAYKAHNHWLTGTHRYCHYYYQGRKIRGWVEHQIRIKLSEGWSPEQIAKRLHMEKGISLSTEAIYKFILSRKRQGEELHKFLRRYRRGRKRFKRRSRYWELQYRRRRSIDDRPYEANNRKVAGHFERDLMLGKRRTGAVLAIVDRKTRFTLLRLVRSTFASVVNEATVEVLRTARQKCKSITNDNGHEFGEFWELEKKLGSKVYFTHPLCPWERGTVENTIGLLRQFVPKGTSLETMTDEDIKALETAINSRPRKSLGYKTPIEIATGKQQQLIKRKLIEELPPEYYEQFYLTPEEIADKRICLGETVALSG